MVTAGVNIQAINRQVNPLALLTPKEGNYGKKVEW